MTDRPASDSASVSSLSLRNAIASFGVLVGGVALALGVTGGERLQKIGQPLIASPPADGLVPVQPVTASCAA